jgi:hypothetical protein
VRARGGLRRSCGGVKPDSSASPGPALGGGSEGPDRRASRVH